MSRRRERKEKRGGSPPRPATPSSPARWFAPRDYGVLIAGAVIALAIAIAYSNTLGNPFIFDDETSITDNGTIRHLWRIGRVLSPPGGGVAVQNRPVVNLSLAINWALGGAHVFGYHLLNLAIHIIAALTLLGVIRRTLLLPAFSPRFGPQATFYATAVALLWGLHPLNTEAVTYVIQRTESLFSMFYLLTLYCCIRGYGSVDDKGKASQLWQVANPPHRWYAAAIAACLLGMGCKEAMATAPLMVLLYDRVFVARSWREVFQRRWGLYTGLAATWLLLILILALASGARGGAAGYGFGMTGWEYARTQFWAICRYLRLAFWPSGLAIDYGTWIARAPSEIIPFALIVMFLLIATSAAYLRWPWAGYLGTWFFAILAPSSSFVPLVTQTVAEKRMYLPSAAIMVFVVFAAGALGKRFINRMAVEESLRKRHARRAAIGALACVAVALGSLTYLRNHDYRSVLSIWTDAVRKRPANPRAYINRANTYLAMKAWENAIADCEKAMELDPNFEQSYVKRGEVYSEMGESDRALADYSRAIELKPDYVQAYLDRGDAYRDRGDHDRAIADYSKAIEIRPDLAEAYNNRGLLHKSASRYDQAVEDFTKAIAANPDFGPLYSNRANVRNKIGQYAQAILDCNRAIELGPERADAHVNRGNAYNFLGEGEPALADYSAAIELDPTLAEAYNNRGGLHIHAREYNRAVADFTKAIELKPDYASAYSNRATAYYYLKEYGKAWTDVNKAKSLGATPPEGLLERLTRAQAGPTTP